MPKKTYTHINSITTAVATTTITFSSIPQNFRDLVLVANGSASTDFGLLVYFNNDNTASNYSRITLTGTGSAVTTANTSGQFAMALNENQTNNIASFMDYSTTDKFKVSLIRINRPTFAVQAFARSWNSTSAISSISLSAGAGTMNVGTTFNLYGIEA